MAYTTSLKVFQGMERIGEAEENFTNVSSGDTLELSNQYIIKDAYPSLSKTAVLTVGGTVQDPTNYTVDYERNQISYSGTDTGDATVQYKYGPYSNQAVQDAINSVEEYIDDYTNSTYDGVKTVSNEIYDGDSTETFYPFRLRPVQSVDTVEVNNPSGSTNPNYEPLTEGLGEDYVTHQDLGIRFLPEGSTPSNAPREVRVTYDYGYSNVPADLERAATEMVIDDLVRGTVSGAMVDGRDNFDPQTVDVNRKSYREVLERYRINRYENMVTLAEKGSIS